MRQAILSWCLRKKYCSALCRSALVSLGLISTFLILTSCDGETSPQLEIPHGSFTKQIWSMGYYNSQTGYGNYPISSLNGVWGGLTHLSVFGVTPNADGTVSNGDTNPEVAYPAIISAAHSNNVKCLLYINVSSNWTSATNSTHLGTFISSMISVVNTYGFDGIDLDWEGTPINFTQMSNLLVGLRGRLGSNKLLNSTAIDDQAAAWAAIMGPLDKLTFMTYDEGGGPNPTWFNSALRTDESSQHSLDLARQRAQNAGMDLSKVNLALAFYGQVQTGATGPRQAANSISVNQIGYNSLVANYSRYLSNPTRDSVAQVPWFSPNGSSWINYDDSTSLTAKINYIKQYPGMGWAIFNLNYGYVSSQSPSHPLLAAVQAAIEKGSPTLKNRLGRRASLEQL